MTRTTATTNGITYSGSECSHCQVRYSDCIEHWRKTKKPCCDRCARTSTHDQQRTETPVVQAPEPGNEFKIGDKVIGVDPKSTVVYSVIAVQGEWLWIRNPLVGDPETELARNVKPWVDPQWERLIVLLDEFPIADRQGVLARYLLDNGVTVEVSETPLDPKKIMKTRLKSQDGMW